MQPQQQRSHDDNLYAAPSANLGAGYDQYEPGTPATHTPW